MRWFLAEIGEVCRSKVEGHTALPRMLPCKDSGFYVLGARKYFAEIHQETTLRKFENRV